ncbi:hydrolase 1, exosortase A system-associated [Sphingomonas sp. MMS12-HWE2-04]|uniref:hydrolase 1, exosortase A system-associated n=1 Tax=Sphingomonas sp. MMS12-HWE2-04 TaxID=3234199 RepID=UPI00384FE87F
MRRLIAFPCAGETLVGTLDKAPGTTGLLIVSGGNEIRCGAHRGMAMLAARLAEAGHPVLRFDRRGIGDSTGTNRGFESSAEDIAAAVALLRAEAGVARVVAFGNCDAATALILFHAGLGIDALLLANPWLVEPQGDLPPAPAIRSHYAARLRDPAQWLRLLRGGVDLNKLGKGLQSILASHSVDAGDLATRAAASLEATEAPVKILLAQGDNTAIAFLDIWSSSAFNVARSRVSIEKRDTASHSFAREGDKQWLFEQVLAALS